MGLTWRDARTTLLVAAAAVVYVLWLTGGALQGMSTRALGAVVFGLGWAACTSNSAQMAVVYAVGSHRRVPVAYVVIASLLGFVALAAGVITLVSANEAMLATLVAAMIALWVLSTVRHAIGVESAGEDWAIREPSDGAAPAARR